MKSVFLGYALSQELYEKSEGAVPERILKSFGERKCTYPLTITTIIKKIFLLNSINHTLILYSHFAETDHQISPVL